MGEGGGLRRWPFHDWFTVHPISSSMNWMDILSALLTQSQNTSEP